MRFLVVGLGSMGKRRVRNLAALDAGEVFGLDPRADRREETAARYGVRTFRDFDDALAEIDPDCILISTPPDLHVRFARLAVLAGKHCFMEASVVDDGLDELIALTRERPGIIVAPSCTLRYHPSVQAMKAIVDDGYFGRPLLFTYHSGQWLPDWHPWEDYRSFYVSRRATGACREILPFELSWLTWLLGPVLAAQGMRAKLSTLDADIDDAYQVLLRFEGGLLGHLLVDVIARAPVRLFRLVSQQATLEWDAAARQVRLYRASLGTWEKFVEPEPIAEPGYLQGEDMYIAEMRDFLAACAGQRPWSHSLEDDRQLLKLLVEIEAAS